MFQFENVNALFNCKVCKGVLVEPIILPCGETVCKAHTDEISSVTVTVIKNTNGFIFGGFTSIPWSSSRAYKADSTAFLFSLTNPGNTPLKLKVNFPENAVCHFSNYRPTFGVYDLHVSSLSNM